MKGAVAAGVQNRSVVRVLKPAVIILPLQGKVARRAGRGRDSVAVWAGVAGGTARSAARRDPFRLAALGTFPCGEG